MTCVKCKNKAKQNKLEHQKSLYNKRAKEQMAQQNAPKLDVTDYIGEATRLRQKRMGQ